MLENRNVEILPDEIQRQLEYHITTRGLGFDVSSFLREIVERSGLLIKNSGGSYEFKHRSFQEYFAARELNNRSDAVQIIAERFLSPAWAGTTFFACGLRPEDEDYLSAILQHEKEPDVEYFIYAIQLGMLTQASYLISNDIKRVALEKTVDALIKSWDELVDDFHEHIYDPSESVSHIGLMDFFRFIVRLSIGSSTLSGALSDLAKHCVEIDSATLTSSSQHAQDQWMMFIVALGCACAGNIDDFVELYDTTQMPLNPSFAFVGLAEIEYQLESDWLREKDKPKLRELRKRLKSRIGKNHDYIQAAMDSRPLYLEEQFAD